MNKLLEKAITEVAKLSEDDQEAIAGRILEDIESERAWDDRFARSHEILAELSNRAKGHITRGMDLPFDPSNRPRK